MFVPIDRRTFLTHSSAGAVALTFPSLVSAGQTKMRKQTFTFKRVGDLEIKADVYRPDDGVVRPVIVWIHGGALIMGNRAGVHGRLKELFLDAGYVVVSIDYRLAPETKIPEILADVQDAFTWIHQAGPKLFGADTDKIAVMGGSAGGYLTLTTGYRIKPRPAALISLYGYGDIAGVWYSRPSEHYRQQQLVSKVEAYRGVRGPQLTDGSIKGEQRKAFYLYCRQQGIWPKEITRYDPDTQPSAFDPFCPDRNVTKDYPPTVLIHGTKDTDVPYELSVRMAKEFQRHGVEHDFFTIPDGGHGLGGGNPKLIADAYEGAFRFVHRHMSD